MVYLGLMLSPDLRIGPRARGRGKKEDFLGKWVEARGLGYSGEGVDRRFCQDKEWYNSVPSRVYVHTVSQLLFMV